VLESSFEDPQQKRSQELAAAHLNPTHRPSPK
jgi:hypothetical protein